MRSRRPNPGTFMDQPLVISLRGGNTSAGGGVAYDASFSAQVVKKR